jgi:hypothetical protein
MECPDFPLILISRNSQNYESELATFDQPTKLKLSSAINERVFPIL